MVIGTACWSKIEAKELKEHWGEGGYLSDLNSKIRESIRIVRFKHGIVEIAVGKNKLYGQ